MFLESDWVFVLVTEVVQILYAATLRDSLKATRTSETSTAKPSEEHKEFGMTIDSTLRIKRGGSKLRNVLKRHERLSKMQEDGRWKDETSTVLGMPKVRVLKLSLKKKKKAKKTA